MTDIIDRHVVMLAPKERDGSEFLAMSEHVESRGLPLALGNDPMLNANTLAAVGMGPSR
jgi:hypothetical protein